MKLDKQYLLKLLELNEQAYVVAHGGKFTAKGYSAYSPIIMPKDGRSELIKGDDLDTWGLLVVDQDTTYVVFRGTQDAPEWAEDFLALPMHCVSSGVCIHRGFSEVWQSLQAPRWDNISTLGRRLVVVGHSLGAAIATLCWTRIGGFLVTFAGPRVGNDRFADRLWEGPTARVISTVDLVPKVPTDPPFRHGGPEIRVLDPSNPDLRTAHSLESYRAGILALPDDFKLENDYWK